jgi:hypothetical protein
MNVRNFSTWIPSYYAWLPAVIVGTVVILVLPWLAVIALLALLATAVVALASLAAALVASVRALARSAFGSSRHESEAGHWAALEPVGVGAAAPALVPSVTWRPHFADIDDQTEMLEEAGFDPIDVYEYPYIRESA